MRRARLEAGFALTELLVSMVLLTVLLGATLTTFSVMERNAKEASDINDVQEQTRLVIDRLAVQLRNIASQNLATSNPIQRATPTDLVFLVVNKSGTPTAANPTNSQRLRYCLDNQGDLWKQSQALTGSVTTPPSSTACPAPTGDGTWGDKQQLSSIVVNGARPLFTYMLAVPPPQRYQEYTTVTGASSLEAIVGVRAEIFADDDVADEQPESTLTTRVFLRNQNRKPTAAFTATPITGLALQLNGSESEDPEGSRLTFEWFDDAKPGTDKKIGEGAVFAATLTAGAHQIWLKVTDPSDNFATTAVQNFNCSTTTGCVPV